MRACDHSEIEEVNICLILRVLGAAVTTMQMGHVIAGMVLSVYSAATSSYWQQQLAHILQATDISAEVCH